MKILAFAASNSRHSINKKLVTYATSLVNDAKAEIIDLNDYEIPLFSEDREKTIGQPELAIKFLSKISDADAVVIFDTEKGRIIDEAINHQLDKVMQTLKDIDVN